MIETNPPTNAATFRPKYTRRSVAHANARPDAYVTIGNDACGAVKGSTTTLTVIDDIANTVVDATFVVRNRNK
jgi:hypothetical protein